jgi:hypothetical protein
MLRRLLRYVRQKLRPTTGVPLTRGEMWATLNACGAYLHRIEKTDPQARDVERVREKLKRAMKEHHGVGQTEAR